MDALTALHTRVSTPRLSGAEPGAEALRNMFMAALRAPDHAQLRPWRFLLVRGDARHQLGELFAQAQLQDDSASTSLSLEKARFKPLRAPLVIVVIASVKPHAKVPEVEQILSTGAAAQNMLIAAHAQGLGAMWRTGPMAYHPLVHRGLGLKQQEKIVGYLYVGEVEGQQRSVEPPNIDDFVTEWIA